MMSKLELEQAVQDRVSVTDEEIIECESDNEAERLVSDALAEEHLMYDKDYSGYDLLAIIRQIRNEG